MEADRLRHQCFSKPAAPSSAGSLAALPLPPPPPTNNPAAAPDAAASAAAKPSLLVTSTQLKRAAPEVTATEQLILQEKEMIENLKLLMSVRELAKGIAYIEPLRTGSAACRAPRPTSSAASGTSSSRATRSHRPLATSGSRSPSSACSTRRASCSPRPSRRRALPWCSPAATLVFVMPLIMVALQEEMLMPIVPGEGPFGMIICPSRELAKQAYDVIEMFLNPLKQAGFPEIRPLLCIGGIYMRTQLEVVKKGVHIVVATPGRLKDLLAKKKMNLENYRL